MTDFNLALNETINISDTMTGTMRKVVDIGTEDIIIARFWVQPFQILEKTLLNSKKRVLVEKILHQLAEDMISLRADIFGYSAEVKRYFEGIKSGKFWEQKGNIQYFKEVFHGKKIVENFYFHAELCKRDVIRFLRLVLSKSSYSWNDFFNIFKNNRNDYLRLTNSLLIYWDNLLEIKAIRGVIEHGDEERDFEITDIYLEKTEKGIAFHQPYFVYPENINVKKLDGTIKKVVLKNQTVIDLMDKHFMALINVCENATVFPLLTFLDRNWQPKQFSLQSMDKQCPIQWSVEPATNPRRTVNNPPV